MDTIKKKETATKSKLALTKAAKQALFLESYAECGNIKWASKKVHISRNEHYDWLQDPDYQARFERANTEACESLEAEAYRRAVIGDREPVLYQGKVATYIRRYSDTLLIVLMKGRMPDKYRDNYRTEIDLKANITSRQIIDLSPLSDEEFEYLGNLHKAVTGITGDAPGLPAGSPEESEESDRAVLPGDGAIP